MVQTDVSALLYIPKEFKHEYFRSAKTGDCLRG